jgi:hypothetical protein
MKVNEMRLNCRRIHDKWKKSIIVFDYFMKDIDLEWARLLVLMNITIKDELLDH